jgi:hypothetical protein
MNWPIRRPATPTTCEGLDLAVVEKTLIDTHGNVTAAARSLQVPSANLRKLVWSTFSLADAIYEQIEQAIDAAEAVLREGLRSEDRGRRLQAATFILAQSDAGRRRGWGRCGTLRHAPGEPQTVTIKWIDT